MYLYIYYLNLRYKYIENTPCVLFFLSLFSVIIILIIESKPPRVANYFQTFFPLFDDVIFFSTQIYRDEIDHCATLTGTLFRIGNESLNSSRRTRRIRRGETRSDVGREREG